METKTGAKALDFDNTELAFGYKSDDQLKRTFRLFKKIDSPFLTRIGPPLVTFALKIGLPLEGMIKRTIFDIFCGGTSLEDTAGRSKELLDAGVYTILDYSVEGEKNDKGFDETRDEIIRTIRHGAGNDAVAFSAMKVTGIAHFDFLAKNDANGELSAEERSSLERSKARMEAICKVAHELQQPVFVDAEESWIQRGIDRWTEAMMEQYNREKPVVYHTVQLYRHDRLEYLRGLIQEAKTKGYVLGVKLVRGAYLEKENDRAKEKGYETPMQPTKAATDKDYNDALRLCIEHIDHVAICAGTHNADSCKLLAELMTSRGIAPDHPHVLFAQLLGMSDNISFNLAHHGYNASKYLPYGPVRAVLPYLFRRADENTSIGGQSSREVALLRKEMKRRGLIRR
ncbi:MAG: proline dehydrogenase family protein [Bacteroidota bacterium]